MSPLAILLIVVCLLCFGGGFHSWGNGYYGYGGVSLGTILLIVVIVLLVRG